jgi:glycerol-3-phosphate acyltransferase PlsY
MPGFFSSIAMGWPYLLAVLLGGYLLGSIPFGLILTRLAGFGDIRRIGSGNIGATNVLRTGNKALAAATLILDGAKGAVAVLVAQHLYGPDAAIVAGAGAFLGHLFPVWLKFHGGKGVATTIGIFLAIAWPVGLITCAVWLLVAVLFRYSSLAALIAVAAAPVAAWFLANHQTAGLALFLAVVVWQRHHENIGRLLKGSEAKISLGGSKDKAA